MDGSTSINGRWNPTQEQICILEALYSQGMRTPNAGQIQRITARMRCYGHIEGKNVFYWFQNHKARQRQKEKQKQQMHHRLMIHSQQRGLDFAYVNRRCLYFQNSATVADALASSMTCNYSPHPNVILSLGSSDRRPNVERNVSTDEAEFTVDHYCLPRISLVRNKTLDLFPVHPTGIPHERKTFPSQNQDFPTYSENSAVDAPREHPLFDFFLTKNHCRQD